MSIDTSKEEPERDRLLNIDEAARYLAIPKATIYTWRTRRVGFGPRAVKFGGSLRFRRSDLDAWIAAHLERVDAPADDLGQRGKAPASSRGEPLTRRRSPRH
jgi:excisionase family DNA binding protein